MKKETILKSVMVALIVMSSTVSNAQTMIYYTYDASGNRVSRGTTIMLTRSATMEQETISETLNPVKKVYIKQHPTIDRVIINIDGWTSETIASISIHNISGYRLYQSSLKQAVTEIDLPTYASGNYILQVTVDNKKYTWKIIKN